MFDPDEVSTALAGALRSHRQGAGLTQEQVAAAARLPGTTSYQRLEAHKRPCSIPQIVALANVFGLAPHQLVHEAELGHPPGRPEETLPPIEPVAVSRGVAAEVRWRREQHRPSLSQADIAKAAGFRWTTTYQRLEHHESRFLVTELVAVVNILRIPAHEVLHAAELRAMTGNLPRSRTGLRQALNIDPE